MIREYAVNPLIVTFDRNTIQRFFSEFGAEFGRIIGDVPHRWKDLLRNEIQTKGLSTMEKRHCLDQMDRLNKSAVIKRDGQSLDGATWIEKAIKLHTLEPFNGILTDSIDIENEQFDYLNMLEHRPNDWVIEQTKQVCRTAKDLADTIDCSLRMSKQVIFVDPYFNPLDDNYRLPFLEYISRVRNGRFGVDKVFLHTCEQNHQNMARRKNRADIERGMQDNVQPLLPAGFSVALWVWPNDHLHDRFVLTNVVGYSFGHGLNETQYQDAIEVNVNRLGNTARENEIRRYSRSAGRLGDEILVIGE